MARLSKQMLDLEFPPPDAGGFVPVYLGDADRAIGQSHASDALPLAPAAAAVQPSQPGEFTNFRTDGAGLHLRKRAQNLEVHGPIVSGSRSRVNAADR